MRIASLKRKTIPKVAVLVMGLTAAVLVATINPPPAQAFPNKQQDCTTCHGPGTVAGTVNAVPSTTTPAAGATYTVLVTEPLNTDQPAGDTGYWIANSTAAGVTGTTTGVYAGYDGTGAATRTATMTAPAAAGTYYYKVWAVKGSTSTTGVTNFKVYSITVAGAPVAVTTTTALGVTPASPVVAPGSPTLKATVTGTGAAGTVEFFNGTTSLGTPTAIAAGVASKTLTGVVAGSYAYKAVFTPTNTAAFTASTSAVSTYVVTVPAPVVVTTTTALAVTPASPVVAPGSPTLKATVSGTGAAGTVEFFNGTTSLGTPTAIAAGVASKTLTGVVAGNYAYKAVFTPTDATAFTSSTSAVSTYLVTAPVPAPTASFTASAISGVAPLAVTLTDTSIGSPTSWLWTFGNGSTSNVQNPPAVTYTTAGTYDVTLIVSNANGASAPVTKTITVTDPAPVVIAPVISALSPANGAIGDTITITGTGFGTGGTVMFGTTELAYTGSNGLSINVVAPIGSRRTMVTVTPTDGDSANTASNSVIFKYDRIARVHVPHVH